MVRLLAAVPVLMALWTTSCSGGAPAVASSKTCDAVRRYSDSLNIDDEEVMRRQADRVVSAAEAEEPSQYVVQVARRFDAALRELRTRGDQLSQERQRYLTEEYQLTLDALSASCEVPLGAPGYDTELAPPPTGTR